MSGALGLISGEPFKEARLTVLIKEGLAVEFKPGKPGAFFGLTGFDFKVLRAGDGQPSFS